MRHKTFYKLLFALGPAFFLLPLSGCFSQKSDPSDNLPGYDLNHPAVIKLPQELDEISGLAWNDKDQSIMGEGDELGIVYKIHPENPHHLERWKFGKPGDYEDIAIVDRHLFVLRSDGNIFSVEFSKDGQVTTTVFDFPEKGNEFETLCYDPFNGLLLLICKDCEADKKKLLSTYAFDPRAKQYVPYPHPIDAKEIAGRLGEKRIKFKPSAAAFNPLTKELFILSSVNGVLVTADSAGNIIDVARLARGMYKQPEGITFSPDGTLYISNESAKTGAADILIFPYRPGKKK